MKKNQLKVILFKSKLCYDIFESRNRGVNMSRMDKYKTTDEIPKRSEKNQELYKQIYNAYDEFENLIVPSNAKEINPSDLKKEVTNRDEYRKVKEYGNITNNKVIRKEIIREEQKKENEIYDINELLDKAVSTNKKEEVFQPTLSNSDYLKKLNLDRNKTNLEQVKEMYQEFHEEAMDEEDDLLKTANLSLEILSDLKGDNEGTIVTEPIKDDEEVEDIQLEEEKEEDFYSNNYKFSKTDFDDKSAKNILKKKDKQEKLEDDDDDFEEEEGHGKIFLKTFLLVLGIILVVAVIMYLISYFNR